MRLKLGKSALTLLIATCAVLAAIASPAAAATFFESPSGNIGCVIGKGSGVRCDIRERDWSPPPKPAGCPVDWGNGLTVAKRGRAGSPAPATPSSPPQPGSSPTATRSGAAAFGASVA